MTEDPRCCGSGTCIIDPAGRCWCGQQWDGDKMSFPAQSTDTGSSQPNNADTTGSSKQNDHSPD